MNLRFQHGDTRWEVDTGAGVSIAISLDFDGPQPNHFGVPEARREPCRAGDFVGSTRLGGSCNVDLVELIAHCNGTHTETVGHIVHTCVPVGELIETAFLRARLVSVAPARWSAAEESYLPEPESDERVVTRASLVSAWDDSAPYDPEALIVRTLPNDEGKRCRNYVRQQAPFFTIEAIEWMNEIGIRHLIVDMPSLDRMHDEGRMVCHHRFWQVPDGSHELADASRPDKTVTEMVYVPDAVVDGDYLVNLQMAPWRTDAAPSRPVLYPIRLLNEPQC